MMLRASQSGTQGYAPLDRSRCYAAPNVVGSCGFDHVCMDGGSYPRQAYTQHDTQQTHGGTSLFSGPGTADGNDLVMMRPRRWRRTTSPTAGGTTCVLMASRPCLPCVSTGAALTLTWCDTSAIFTHAAMRAPFVIGNARKIPPRRDS